MRKVSVSALRNLLPRSRPLPEAMWRSRHRFLLGFLWAHVAGILLYMGLRGSEPSHVVLETLFVGVPALLASVRWRSRAVASALTALGLVMASAVLVHLSGGYIEFHFHYFLVVALVVLYQDALPFAVAVLFVLAQHGLFGAWMPSAVYNHPAAQQDPWKWALIHATFIGATALTSLVTWKANERAAEALENQSQRTRRILDSAAEGMVGIGSAGEVVFANQAARHLLGWDELLISSHAHHRLVHPGGICPPLCGICAVLAGRPMLRDVATSLARSDGMTLPVELTVAPLRDEDFSGAVLTFHDRSEQDALRASQEEVRRLAELEKIQRSEVLALQETLKPRRPNFPDVELGVRYVPADDAPVGGDFYDWVVLPSGELQLVVVDMLGKGLTATKDALAVTHTLRTLSLEGVPLEELVTRTDALLLEQSPETIATLLVARYDRCTGRLLLAGGSHPPALLVRRGGEVVETSSPGLAIGYPGAGTLEVTEYHLEPGDVVVMYTDGLIEGNRDIIEGIHALGVHASTTRALPAERLASDLVSKALVEADRRDDSLALVLRRLPRPFSLQLSPVDQGSFPAARRSLTSWLEAAGFAGSIDVLRAVSELCADAISAARNAGSSVPIEVTARFEGLTCILQVEDRGTPSVPAQRSQSLPGEGELGRGLSLLSALGAVTEVVAAPSGRRVRVVVPLDLTAGSSLRRP